VIQNSEIDISSYLWSPSSLDTPTPSKIPSKLLSLISFQIIEESIKICYHCKGVLPKRRGFLEGSEKLLPDTSRGCIASPE